MRKYLVSAVIMRYVRGNYMDEQKVKEPIVAHDNWSAGDKFVDIISKEFENADVDVDIDDMYIEDIGPADVLIDISRKRFMDEDFRETMTVGEFIKYLGQNFDKDSNIYIHNNEGIISVYGNIMKDDVRYKDTLNFE